MNRCSAALIACLLASCAGEPPVPAGPSAEFPEKNQDFGAVVQGRRVEHAYEVRNRGSSDLILERVDASEVLTVQGFDPVIPAGGSGKIRLALDTAALRGVGKLAARVHTNDPKTPAAILRFDVRVVRPLEVEPRDRFYFFQTRGQGSEKRLSLVSYSDEPVNVIGVACDSPHFRPRVQAGEPGERYELAVALDPATPPGKYEATITVSTDLASFPKLEIPVRAIIGQSPAS